MAIPKCKPPVRGSRQVGQLNAAQALELARASLARGDFAEAEKVLSALLKALPKQPSALHLMGALHNLRGDSANALTLMQQAVQLQPQDANIWNDIGLVYGRLERVDDAILAYQRCIDLAGKTILAARALDNLGRLQLQHDASAAEQSSRRATEFAPGFGLAWYGLAQALIVQDKLESGLQAAHHAVRLMPKSMAREVLADVLSKRGHQQAAIDFYHHMLQDDPDNPRGVASPQGVDGPEVP